MKVDSAEVMWQESDAIVWNTLAHELDTVVECLPAEGDDVKDIEMPGGELRDGSDGVEQETMTDGEQRDGSVAIHASHSKRDLERVKKALMSFFVHLGRPGVKELIRVLKHGRASELVNQEARRMRCDVCVENVQPNIPRPAVHRQALDFHERTGLDILSLPHWEGFTKFVNCLYIVCLVYFVSNDHTVLVGNDGTGPAASLP